jgi:hypothetical protein
VQDSVSSWQGKGSAPLSSDETLCCIRSSHHEASLSLARRTVQRLTSTVCRGAKDREQDRESSQSPRKVLHMYRTTTADFMLKNTRKVDDSGKEYSAG